LRFSRSIDSWPYERWRGDSGIDFSDAAGSPEESLDPSRKFSKAEWFGDVVVSAKFQTQHPVQLFGFGCEHHDRELLVDFARAFADFQPVEFGEHQVEENERILILLDLQQPRFTIPSTVEFVADAVEMDLDQVADVGVVFDDEYFFVHRGLFIGERKATYPKPWISGVPS
jgi:hypothetical protein